MTKIETMTPEQERQILRAVESVIKMANAGTDPSEAVAKVASAQSLSPDFVHRMCQAFNTSKTLALIQDGDFNTKLAMFAPADPRAALKLMFPDKVEAPGAQKTASWIPGEGLQAESHSFRKAAAPALTESAAAPLARDGGFTLRKLYALRGDLQRELKNAELNRDGAYREALDCLQKVASYFREIPSLPFEQVDAVVCGHWGDEGRAVMNVAHALVKGAGFTVKRAEHVRQTFAPESGPYQLVREALTARNTFYSAEEKVAEAKASLEHFEEEFAKRLPFFKAAASGGASGLLTNVLLLDKMKDLFKQKPMNELVSEASDELADPDYDAQQRAIQAQVMLNDLMHSDPVIGRHPPAKVMDTYNRFAASFPRVASSEIGLQAYMRRMLEGGEVDPHDIATAGDIESTMSRNSAQPKPGEGAKAILDND